MIQSLSLHRAAYSSALQRPRTCIRIACCPKAVAVPKSRAPEAPKRPLSRLDAALATCEVTTELSLLKSSSTIRTQEVNPVASNYIDMGLHSMHEVHRTDECNSFWTPYDYMATKEIRAADLRAIGVEPPAFSMSPTAYPNAASKDPAKEPDTGARKAWDAPQLKARIVHKTDKGAVVRTVPSFRPEPPIHLELAAHHRALDTIAASLNYPNDDSDRYDFGPYFGPRYVDANTGAPAFLPAIVELSVAGPIGSAPKKIHVVDPRSSAAGHIGSWHAEQEAAHEAELARQQEEKMVAAAEATEAAPVEIDIAIKCATQPGQRVWLVGSTAELGNWCPSSALKLRWSEGHVWRGTLELPSSAVNSMIEMKAILTNECDGTVTWQDGGNKTCEVAKEMPAIAFDFR